MNKWILIIILTVPAYLWIFQGNQKKPAENVSVDYVIDGDTFTAENGKTYRLIGVDCPEIAHHGKAGEPGGKEAKRFLIRMIGNKEVSVSYGPDRKGPYGRELIYLWMDSVFINQLLIRKGYAEPMFYEPNTKYRKEFYKLYVEKN